MYIVCFNTCLVVSKYTILISIVYQFKRLIQIQEIFSSSRSALQCTFFQSAERMRKIRKKHFPKTPLNLRHLNELLQLLKHRQFVETLQNLLKFPLSVTAG